MRTPSIGFSGSGPHSTRQVDADRALDRITYAQLDAHTRRLAAGFIDAGVGKGKRVGLIMPNGVAWAEIAWALTRIGAVLVPLSTLPQASELVAHLRVASVQALIAVEEFRGHATSTIFGPNPRRSPRCARYRPLSG